MRADFRRWFGLNLDDVGDTFTFGEAWDHVQTLRDTPGSWFHAALVNWAWPATWAEIATIAAATSTVNVNRDTKKQREPIEFSFPWTGVEDEAEQVTDEEREALKATLRQYSAFRD